MGHRGKRPTTSRLSYGTALLRQKLLYIIQGIHKRMLRFQKLTRNLFLALHGHNLHRQQQQLSKFLTSHLAGASFLNRARNSRCTVITDLDTSKRSTQKAFSCCDAILETGPAVSKRSELLVAHGKLGQLLLLLTVYIVPVV